MFSLRCFSPGSIVSIAVLLIAATIPTFGTQATTSNERITTASGVRLRNLPQSSAQEVTRLRLGTVVTILGTSTAKEKIGASEDYWYSIKTSDGKTGWLFGSFTAPFDAHKREQIYLKLAQDRLKLENKTFGDLVDLHLFLKESVVEVKNIDIAAELEFMRLEVLDASVKRIPDAISSNSGHNYWIKENINELFYNRDHDLEHGMWNVTPQSFWKLEIKYHSLPIGDRIAWTAATSASGRDCEDDISCWFAVMKKATVEYLIRHPKGAHANEAIDYILTELTAINHELSSNFYYKNKDGAPVKYREELKAEVIKVRKTLIDTLVIPRKAELAKQMDLLIKALG